MPGFALKDYAREDWEAQYGPLPESFEGDRVVLDLREDGNLLPSGLPSDNPTVSDTRLIIEILRRMAAMDKRCAEFDSLLSQETLADHEAFAAIYRAALAETAVYDRAVRRWREIGHTDEPPTRKQLDHRDRFW